MKNTLRFFFIISILLVGCTNDSFLTQPKFMGLKGDVYSLTVRDISTDNGSQESTYIFDRDGYITSSRTVNTRLDNVIETTHRYNDRKLLCEKVSITKNEYFTSKSIKKLHEEREKALIYHAYDRSEESTDTTPYETIIIKKVGNNTEVNKTSDYGMRKEVFNRKGLIIRTEYSYQKEDSSKTTLISDIKYKGMNPFKQTTIINNTTHNEFTFDYLESDNKDNWIKANIYRNDTLTQSIERHITYLN